jgi:hypothetical protein
MTAKTFFGNFFIVIGGFVAIFAGGCGVIFEIVAFTDSGSSGENYLGSPILPLIYGGIPALFGFGLFMLGRWIKRRAVKKDTAA